MAITRRKTEEIRQSVLKDGSAVDCVVWSILDNGNVVGEACATYKTKTQRTFDAHMTVDGITVTVEGIRSIAKAVRALTEKLTAAQAEATENDSADANIEIVESEDATA
jgi:hypothetical protein